MDDQPIGRRVAYWRNRRKMSQQLFADRLGKSKSWVDKVERGVRRLDRFSTISRDRRRAAARRPGADGPRSGPAPGDASTASTRSRSPRSGPRWSGTTRSVRSSRRASEPPPLAELRKAVGHAWLTFQHSKYGVLARMLPKLLRDAQAADAAYDAATTASAGGPPARAGLPDRLVDAAQAGRARPGLAGRRPGHHGLPARRRRAARRHWPRSGSARAVGAGPVPARAGDQRQRRQPDRARRGRGRHPANGCPCTGCCCCRAPWPPPGSATRPPSATCSPAAEEAAKQLGGDDNHYWTCFGPTNVAFHRAAAEVEMGDGGPAVETHEAIDPLGFAAHAAGAAGAATCSTSPAAYAQIGDVARAGETLIEADRLAPERDPLPADRPRAAHRRAAPHPGRAAGRRSPSSPSRWASAG